MPLSEIEMWKKRSYADSCEGIHREGVYPTLTPFNGAEPALNEPKCQIIAFKNEEGRLIYAVFNPEKPMTQGSNGKIYELYELQADHTPAKESHYVVKIIDNEKGRLGRYEAKLLSQHYFVAPVMEKGNCIYLVTEHIKGDALQSLEHRIVSALELEESLGIEGQNELPSLVQDSLSFPQRLDVIAQIARFFLKLHEQSILHRDVKPTNILLEKRPAVNDEGESNDFVKVHVIDYGEAIMLQGDEPSSFELEGRGILPLHYAPEVVKDRVYGKPADVWSMVGLFSLLLGVENPDQDKYEKAKILRGSNEVYQTPFIVKVCTPTNWHSPIDFNKIIVAFLNRMQAVLPEERPDMVEVDQFFSVLRDLYLEMEVKATIASQEQIGSLCQAERYVTMLLLLATGLWKKVSFHDGDVPTIEYDCGQVNFSAFPTVCRIVAESEEIIKLIREREDWVSHVARCLQIMASPIFRAKMDELLSPSQKEDMECLDELRKAYMSKFFREERRVSDVKRLLLEDKSEIDEKLKHAIRLFPYQADKVDKMKELFALKDNGSAAFDEEFEKFCEALQEDRRNEGEVFFPFCNQLNLAWRAGEIAEKDKNAIFTRLWLIVGGLWHFSGSTASAEGASASSVPFAEFDFSEKESLCRVIVKLAKTNLLTQSTLMTLIAEEGANLINQLDQAKTERDYRRILDNPAYEAAKGEIHEISTNAFAELGPTFFCKASSMEGRQRSVSLTVLTGGE